MDWKRLDLSLDEIIKKTDGGKRIGKPRPQTKPRSSVKRPTTKPTAIKGPIKASISKKPAPASSRDTKGRAGVAKILPTAKFVVKNDKTRTLASKMTARKEIITIAPTDRKARMHPERGLITLRNDGPVKTKEPHLESQTRSRSRSIPTTEKRSERLEIRITNEKALQPQPSMSSESIVPAPVISPNLSVPSIPNSGLLSTSSHFRTPMAVMDLYTSRYARPTLEPYRPPPVIQQFYRSLADTTALGHIPPHYNPMGQNPAAYQQQQPLQQHHQQSNNIIRKPYEN